MNIKFIIPCTNTSKRRPNLMLENFKWQFIFQINKLKNENCTYSYLLTISKIDLIQHLNFSHANSKIEFIRLEIGKYVNLIFN